MRHSVRDKKTGRFTSRWFWLPPDGSLKYQVEWVHIEAVSELQKSDDPLTTIFTLQELGKLKIKKG